MDSRPDLGNETQIAKNESVVLFFQENGKDAPGIKETQIIYCFLSSFYRLSVNLPGGVHVSGSV
ncbi:hypothetical protein DSO57_1036969 [Entomophthora muscae]|uniref:Uncharacterized protein n=1 Tax=Entomophthora muscae TaxID=34485 RepID=A0ACC2TXU7_9FUNG|nr:hypothetical protein DSO57_1036969 [Entomophthora muscae]